MSYATERDAVSRTPQTILEIGVITCGNYYAQTRKQHLQYTEDIGNAVWTLLGGATRATDISPCPRNGEVVADRLIISAAADGIEQISDQTAASRAFTYTLFAAHTGGSGSTLTITIEIADGGAESTTKQISITSKWTRFAVHKKFSAGAVGNARVRVKGVAGDTGIGSVILRYWGHNLTENAGAYDGEAILPYVKRTNEADTVLSVMASRCQAADAGNGSRCYYSRITCQDPANFNPGNVSWTYPTNATLPSASAGDPAHKVYRFCHQDAALPVVGADIWPLLKSVDIAAQKIDPERAVTVSERAKAQLFDFPATWNWNEDKANVGALTNTATPSGHFWRRFMRIYRNYANPQNYATVYAAMVAAGLTETDFQQRAKYLLTNVEINGRGGVTLTMTDRLKLLKTKAPAKISETNLLNGAITSGATSITVDDASELTDPAANAADASPDYIVTIQIESEFVNVTAKNGNALAVQRGRWGSTAASHADNTAWKEVLMFGTERTTPSLAPIGKNPIDISIELLLRAGLTGQEIDVATLRDDGDSEKNTWLASSVDASAGTESGVLFKRAGVTLDQGNGGISVQQEIEKLLGGITAGKGSPSFGIRAVTMLDLWVGEDQIVTGRVFAPARPSVTLVELTDNADLLKDSIEVDDNEESRITRVIIAYDLAAGKAGDSIGDYQRFIAVVGGDEEDPVYFGDERTKVILSPWIKAGDTSTPTKLGKHLLSRYRQPARLVNFDLELRGDGNKAGDFVYVTSARFQKPDGSTDSQRIMALLSKKRAGGRISFEAQDVSVPLGRRYAFIAPAGYPNYDAASAAQRRYGYIGKAGVNTVGAAADNGYYIW